MRTAGGGAAESVKPAIARQRRAARGAGAGAVIGTGNFSWDVFGPGVNLAARVEGVSGPMEITVSEGTRELLGTGFSCEDCGVHDLKGFGRQRLFRLLK